MVLSSLTSSKQELPSTVRQQLLESGMTSLEVMMSNCSKCKCKEVSSEILLEARLLDNALNEGRVALDQLVETEERLHKLFNFLYKRCSYD